MDLLFHPRGNGIEVRHVKGLANCLVGAMLGYKSVETVLATSNCNDKDAIGNHALGESQANARGGTGDEDGPVWEGHYCGLRG